MRVTWTESIPEAADQLRRDFKHLPSSARLDQTAAIDELRRQHPTEREVVGVVVGVARQPEQVAIADTRHSTRIERIAACWCLLVRRVDDGQFVEKRYSEVRFLDTGE